MNQKKFSFLFIFTLISIFAFNANVFADITCAAIPDASIDESIVDLVHMIIRIIQIAVPVLLVVLGMIDFLKGLVAQKEDEIKKGQQTFIKRVIAAVLVFFVIAIVKFIISAVASNSDVMDCANCFIQGSDSPSCNGGNDADADAV